MEMQYLLAVELHSAAALRLHAPFTRFERLRCSRGEHLFARGEQRFNSFLTSASLPFPIPLLPKCFMLFPADCRIRRDSSFPELLCKAIFSSEVVKYQGVVEEYLTCHSKLRGVKFYPLSVPEHLLKLSNYILLTRIRVGAERHC